MHYSLTRSLHHCQTPLHVKKPVLFIHQTRAGLMRINSGQDAFDTVDFTVFGASAGFDVGATAAIAEAKVVLVGGSVSIFDIQIGLGITTGFKIDDGTFSLKFLGNGFSVGKKVQVCALDNCFGVDLGRLYDGTRRWWQRRKNQNRNLLRLGP